MSVIPTTARFRLCLNGEISISSVIGNGISMAINETFESCLPALSRAFAAVSMTLPEHDGSSLLVASNLL
jgi:hypothetical protein